MATKPALLDLHRLEYEAVRLRNVLFFLLGPKGDRARRKYFIIGHPRTGTQTLHRLLKANEVATLHSPGNWNTRAFDAFSDRGNYQPFALFDRYYRDAVFVLNTRPAFKYIKSRMNQTARSRGKRGRPGSRYSVANIRNELLHRNRYFLSVLRHFDGQDNLTVVNIERPGALAFVAERTGLDFPGEIVSNHQRRQVLTDADTANIDTAFEQLGIADEKMNPFIIPQLLDADEQAFVRDFLERHRDAVHL